MIVNAPLRGNINITTWYLSLIKYLCNGRTWTRDPKNFATDKQLQELAVLGKPIIYSVCLARTPKDELAEIKRYEGFGIEILGVRYGNEEGFHAFKKSKDPNTSEKDCLVYIKRSKEFQFGYNEIYCGEFVRNTQASGKYRSRWNDYLRANISQEARIDLHVYQDWSKPDISLDYFDETSKWEQSLVIIESGINTSTVGDKTDFYPRTIALWDRIIEKLRNKDIMGVQLMESISPVGLIHEGKLTPLGEWVNKNEEVNTVTIIKIVDNTPWWSFKKLRNVTIYLDTFPYEINRKILRTEFPKVGDVWLG